MGFTESILFLDANVYLHFRYIEIDWKRITASEQVRIIVPRVTVSELDKNKYDPRRRTRATSILNTFEKASSSTGTFEIRPGVSLEVQSRHFQIDYENLGLAKGKLDDEFVGAVLHFKKQHPQSEIVVVSNDYGCRLTASSHGLKTIKPSEDFEIEIQDEAAKKIRELEEQVRQQKSKLPELRLLFKTGRDRLSIKKRSVTTADPRDIEQRIDFLMKEYPAIQIREEPKSPRYDSDESAKLNLKVVGKDGEIKDLELTNPVLHDLPDELLRTRDRLLESSPFGIPRKDIIQYNEKLAAFYEETRIYLQTKAVEYANSANRHLRINCNLENVGSARASDIDIRLSLPKDAGIVFRSEIPDPPTPPRAPEKPKSQIDSLASYYGGSDFHFPQIEPVATFKAVIGPNISVSSLHASYHVRSLKHRNLYALPPLYLFFPSFEAIRSVHIRYLIHPEELAREIKGKLHVIVRANREQ